MTLINSSNSNSTQLNSLVKNDSETKAFPMTTARVTFLMTNQTPTSSPTIKTNQLLPKSQHNLLTSKTPTFNSPHNLAKPISQNTSKNSKNAKSSKLTNTWAIHPSSSPIATTHKASLTTNKPRDNNNYSLESP